MTSNPPHLIERDTIKTLLNDEVTVVLFGGGHPINLVPRHRILAFTFTSSTGNVFPAVIDISSMATEGSVPMPFPSFTQVKPIRKLLIFSAQTGSRTE